MMDEEVKSATRAELEKALLIFIEMGWKPSDVAEVVTRMRRSLLQDTLRKIQRLRDEASELSQE